MRTALLAAAATIALLAAPRASSGEPMASWQCGPASLEAHSPFWVSLHHVLWAHAFEKPAPDAASPAWAVPDPLAQSEGWRNAVAWYRERFDGLDLGRDRFLRELDYRLADTPVDGTPEIEDRPDLTATLVGVAPAYLAQAWPAHDAACRRMAEDLAPLMRTHGKAVAERLAAVYGAPWPGEPIPVLLVVHANWAGAYTTYPPLIRQAPDARAPGAAALFESVWHEATHLLEGLDGVVRSAANAAAEARGAALEPRDLWHTVLFWTVGEVVREVGVGGPEYVPYAERNGLYRGAWAQALEPIRTHWGARMRGEVERGEAVERIVADLLNQAPAR